MDSLKVQAQFTNKDAAHLYSLNDLYPPLSAGTKAPPTFASLALLPATRRGEGEREETKDPHLMQKVVDHDDIMIP